MVSEIVTTICPSHLRSIFHETITIYLFRSIAGSSFSIFVPPSFLFSKYHLITFHESLFIVAVKYHQYYTYHSGGLQRRLWLIRLYMYIYVYIIFLYLYTVAIFVQVRLLGPDVVSHTSQSSE